MMHSTHFIYSYMEGRKCFNDALNTFYLVIWKEGNVLTMHSTHFIYSYMEGRKCFNDALNTFYLQLYGRKEMF